MIGAARSGSCQLFVSESLRIALKYAAFRCTLSLIADLAFQNESLIQKSTMLDGTELLNHRHGEAGGQPTGCGSVGEVVKFEGALSTRTGCPWAGR